MGLQMNANQLSRHLGLALFLSVTASVPAAASGAEPGKAFRFDLLLIGGGMHTCSSRQLEYCRHPERLPTTPPTRYRSNKERLTELRQSPYWQNPARRDGVLAYLEKQPLHGDAEAVGQALGMDEDMPDWNLVTDTLEERSPDTRERVDFADNRDDDTRALVQAFLAEARLRAGGARPYIVITTASSRDSFAAVDFYRQLFQQAGADTAWLALDSAVQAARGDKDCEHLAQRRAELQGAYAREHVYPTLALAAREACSNPERNLTALRRAHGVFFNGGDQSLVRRAWRKTDGTDSPELALLRQRLARHELVVAGTSAGTAVMSGGMGVPMIASGDSLAALGTGAFAMAPLGGTCQGACRVPEPEEPLTYAPDGGLGLFPFGPLDTHFAERGRELRLLRLAGATRQRLAVGVDENTALAVRIDPSASPFRVLGAGGVWFAELAQPVETTTPWQLNATNVHYLRHGQSGVFNGLRLSLSGSDCRRPASAGKTLDSPPDLLAPRAFADWASAVASQPGGHAETLVGGYRLVLTSTTPGNAPLCPPGSGYRGLRVDLQPRLDSPGAILKAGHGLENQ